MAIFDQTELGTLIFTLKTANYLEMSFFKSVTVPEPFLKTVMSAEVSRRLRIFDMKSGSTGGGPPEIEEAVIVRFLEIRALLWKNFDKKLPEDIIPRLCRPPKDRPRSAKVPRRPESCPAATIR